MIESFKCEETKKIRNGERSKKIPIEIQATARRKSKYLNAASNLLDLKIPPGNKLEALKGVRKGQYSIRINKQWRICFKWSKNNNAMDVEITDYH